MRDTEGLDDMGIAGMVPVAQVESSREDFVWVSVALSKIKTPSNVTLLSLRMATYVGLGIMC